MGKNDWCFIFHAYMAAIFNINEKIFLSIFFIIHSGLEWGEGGGGLNEKNFLFISEATPKCIIFDQF